jgi:phosphatidylglycerophosphate synthase
MTCFRQLSRVDGGLAGSLERPALRWLAAHTPRWTSPDQLTAIGVLGAVVTCVGYCCTHVHEGFLWLASSGLIVNWLGDSLDGTLARFRAIERPRYGFCVDHTADAASQVLVLVGVGLSPFARLDIACLTLIGYLLLSVVVYIRAIVDGEFRITFAGVGPTEARLALVLGNTAVLIGGNPEVRLPWVTMTAADLGLAVAAAVLVLTFSASALGLIRRLRSGG